MQSIVCTIFDFQASKLKTIYRKAITRGRASVESDAYADLIITNQDYLGKLVTADKS